MVAPGVVTPSGLLAGTMRGERTWSGDSVVRGSVVEQDFGEFVRTAMPGLLRYGHALTGDPDDAAELVRSVLEKVGARWASVRRKRDDAHSHVRRVMANSCTARWRRARPAVGEPRADAFADEPLWLALRELPARQRAVIVLRYHEKLSDAEIAASLGVRVRTVQGQAAKAMAALRTRLRGVFEEGGE